MQFSEHWLRDLVEVSMDSEKLGELLTMAGLELEHALPAAPPCTGVVVARVLTVDRHPDADKLKLCKVDVGSGAPLTIVCGAPNVAAGMMVPCATVGAELPGMTIKLAKVRGVESQGMLCSARELGLSEDHSGLLALAPDAPVGRDIRQQLGLDDKLVTLKLTPNRADCLSLAGIARELAALTGARLRLPEVSPVAPAHAQSRAIVLDAPDACPRYCGRIITGVDAGAPSPEWMVRRLARSGIRSISALVDITNYVMLELGQPLHAFDNSHLVGAIHVRYPAPGEQLTLLNGDSVTPERDTALIADESGGGRALALAGIMGGEDSGISAATRDLFLESAFFSPKAIAGRARALGFSSDASYRYERGVDFALQRTAIERATRLVVDICGGLPGPVVEAVSESHLPRRPEVGLRTARAQRVIGHPFTAEQIEKILRGLGFPLRRAGEDFHVTPPSHRFDIEIEEDLIEEVARVFGYDNIPARAPTGRLAMLAVPEEERSPMALRHLVAHRDYQEVVNFSFVDGNWEKDFCANAQAVVLANPIASQMDVMRSSLIGGLVNTLAFNLKRRINRVRVFEIGRCFRRDERAQPVPGFDQPQRLAALAAGPAHPEQWGEAHRNVDFYDVKSDLVALFAPQPLRFEKTDHPALHPGRAARVWLDGKDVGVIGELHPRWVQKYELAALGNAAPVVFEIELGALLHRPLPRLAEVSRFPSVVRDLALVVARDLPLQALQDALTRAAPAIVRGIELFDQYQGAGVAPDQKSLAFRIVMQDTEKTLADADADAVVAGLLDAAAKEFGARLRA